MKNDHSKSPNKNFNRMTTKSYKKNKSVAKNDDDTEDKNDINSKGKFSIYIFSHN